MGKRTLLLVTIAIALMQPGHLSLVACDKGFPSTSLSVQVEEPSLPLTELYKSCQVLGWEILHQTSKRGSNVLFSPISALQVMAMAAIGAEGDTQAEIFKALGLPDLAKSGLKAMEEFAFAEGSRFTIANAVAINSSFPPKEAYGVELQRYFCAPEFSIDSRGDTDKALQTINSWVEQKTGGAIPALLQSEDITQQTKLLLLSACNFLGAWHFPFNEQLTSAQLFYPEIGTPSMVPMMKAKAPLRYGEDDIARFVEMEIHEEGQRPARFSVLFAMPSDSKELNSLESSLNQQTLERWLSELQPRDVALSLPRFTISTHIDLKSAFQGLGVKLAFEPSANFSGIFPSDELYISSLIHGAFLKIDESGLEVSGATAAALLSRSGACGREPIVFSCDRPFFFILVDKHMALPLFIGKISTLDL